MVAAMMSCRVVVGVISIISLDFTGDDNKKSRKSAMIIVMSYVTSPASETRLADSLIGLLGSPPPEKQLNHNPAFSELQSLLKSELKQQTLPETLLKLPKTSIFTREQQLQHYLNSIDCLVYLLIELSIDRVSKIWFGSIHV
jgi:hypothetical protein